MTTPKTKLLRTSLVLGAALLFLAPLASSAGSLSVSVGLGGPAYVGYGYYPAYGYGYYPAYGYGYAPGYVWVAPHWGYYGGHRLFIHGYWRHRAYYHRGYYPYRRW